MILNNNQFYNIHFQCLRSVWTNARDLICAYDELEMAKIRFRLRKSYEPKSDSMITYKLENHQVNQQKLKLTSDKIISKNELSRKLGQLRYLRNLAVVCVFYTL